MRSSEENRKIFSAVGNRIRQLRTEHRLSQEELAEIVNYSGKHISSIECGNTAATYEILLTLSQKFKLPVDYFFQDISDISKNYLAFSMIDLYSVDRIQDSLDFLKATLKDVHKKDS